MSTTINVTVDDGGLPAKNRQQTAANRQAFVQGQASQQAAQQGADQRAADRKAAGLDPTTGRPLASAGASSRLPRIRQEPAANRKGLVSYVFSPNAGQPWRLDDGSILNPWFLSGSLSNLKYLPTSGPGNRSAIEYEPSIIDETFELWGGLESEKNQRYITTKGATFDGWVRFPTAGPDTNLESIFECGLSRNPMYMFPDPFPGYYYDNRLTPGINFNIQTGQPINQNSRIYASCVYYGVGTPPDDITYATGLNCLESAEGASLSDLRAWHHYAVEFTALGYVTIYFDGVAVKSADFAFQPRFDLMDTFIATGVSFQINVGEISNIQTSRIRYTKGLRYNGRNFAPS